MTGPIKAVMEFRPAPDHVEWLCSACVGCRLNFIDGERDAILMQTIRYKTCPVHGRVWEEVVVEW